MYHFAVITLLALATIKLVDFVIDNVDVLSRFRSLMTYAAAIGGVWLLNYSLFEGFAVEVRNRATGVWLTGFIVAGLTVAWRALFAWLTHEKAMRDETLGEHTPMRQVA